MTSDGRDRIIAAIDGAQDFCDPLEGLAGRAVLDAGAAFRPEVLERLSRAEERRSRGVRGTARSV